MNANSTETYEMYKNLNTEKTPYQRIEPKMESNDPIDLSKKKDYDWVMNHQISGLLVNGDDNGDGDESKFFDKIDWHVMWNISKNTN